MFVYLDESGDLGFNFTKCGTSRYFVVTLLVVPTQEENRRLGKAVERTLKNKMRRKRKSPTTELKGSLTKSSIKIYFFKQMRQVEYRIYTLVLNKARVFEELRSNKARLYNFMSRLLIEKCPLSIAQEKVILTLDKSKDQKEITEFNRYLLIQAQKQLSEDIIIEIYHRLSHESRGIQAADLFSWGIFRKYERKDAVWYELFKNRIAFEALYLPNKKGL